MNEDSALKRTGQDDPQCFLQYVRALLSIIVALPFPQGAAARHHDGAGAPARKQLPHSADSRLAAVVRYKAHGGVTRSGACARTVGKIQEKWRILGEGHGHLHGLQGSIQSDKLQHLSGLLILLRA